MCETTTNIYYNNSNFVMQRIIKQKRNGTISESIKNYLNGIHS